MISYALFGIPPSGFDPDHRFFHSKFVPAYVLATLRALIAVYAFTTMIVCYSWLAHNVSTNNLQDINLPKYTLSIGSSGIHQSFSFFTYLTYWSLGFYFTVSSVHTFVYAKTGTTWLHRLPASLTRLAPLQKPFQLLHSLFYTTATTFPFLVTIVFWGTMYAGPFSSLGRFEQWINISVHGLNSLFALLEILLPATRPAPLSHLSFVLLILSLYLGLAYLTRYTKGFYVYEWMNPAYGWRSIVLHILGYTGGIIGIYFVVWGAVWARCRVSEGRREREREMEKLDGGSDINV